MDPLSAPSPAPRRRVLTRARVLLYGLTLLVCGFSLAYITLTDSARIAEIAGDTLARMTGAKVRISGAAFELNGTIRLFDVEMRIPDVPGGPVGGDRLFTADQILIQHNMWALAKGGLDVQSVSLIRPTFYPTEDVDHGKFTFQYLKPKSTPKKKDKSRSIDLPDVHLSQALVVFGEITEGKYRAIQTSQLNGDLTRQPKETGIYSFALRQNQEKRQVVLSGDFDLYNETMTARMQLGQLKPGDERIEMLPRQIRNLFKQIKPTGTFPSIQFGYDKERQFNALVEIADGGVNVPWGETAIHIENTRGSVGIEQNNRLIVDLQGQARGSNYGATYEVKGTVDGFEDDAVFNLKAKIRGQIPERPSDLDLMPTAIRSIIEQVSPRGGFEVNVALSRDAASGEIITSGTVQVIDGAIKYRAFPYPLENLNGAIAFDNDRIDIHNIKGIGPQDDFGRRGRVTLNGFVIGGGRRPGVHVSILAEDAPVDQHLRAALDPKDEQQIYDMFFCLPQHERFLDEETGSLQTTKQKQERLAQLVELNETKRKLTSAVPRNENEMAAIDATIERLTRLSQRPVFDLGGLARAQVDVRTIPGERRTYTTIRATAPGLNIAYEHWPYPLTFDEGGELLINLPAVSGEVVRVKGGAKGLRGGVVAVDGIMLPPLERGRNLIPDLKLTATGVPLDDLLLLSLPPADAKVVQQLHLGGKIDIDGRIVNDDQHRIDFRIGVALTGGTAKPNDGRYDLTDVNARLTVHRRGVDIHSVDARHGQSKLQFATLPPIDGKPTSLVLSGTNINFKDHILDLIPAGEQATAQIHKLINDYDPKGIFDFKLDHLAKVDGKTDYRLELTPLELDIKLQDERMALKKMSGKAIVTSRQVHLEELTGDFGTGRFRLDGTINTQGTAAYDLGFDIESDSYCRVTRMLLPSGAKDAINSLKLEGGYRIRDAKLHFDPAATDKEALRFDATLWLDQAKALVGVPLTQMTGDLKIAVTEKKLGDLPTIDIQVDRIRLRAAERWIDPLSVRIASGDKPGWFNISKLKGDMYGGSITGSGALYRQDNTDRYKMEIALQEVALDAFVNPTDPRHQPVANVRQGDIQLIGDSQGDPPSRVPEPDTRPRSEPVIRKQRAGMLSASLAIEGESKDPDTKRGRGDLRIRDAAIYETQLGLSLLQILNLSAPVSKSFDRVEASYLLDGDLVHLERIHFVAPTLTITGKGTMKYSTLALDLSMTSANPRGIELGPLTDVLKLLKDELVSIRVGGTLTEPKANVQTLRGITGAVDEVIGKPKEPRKPLLPPIREPEGK